VITNGSNVESNALDSALTANHQSGLSSEKETFRQISRRLKSITNSNPSAVYLIENSASKLFKIGFSGDPKSRLRQLQSESAYTLEIVSCRMVYGPCVQAVEQLIHKLFAHCRTHGEWFKLTEDEVAWFMRENWLSLHADRSGSMVTFDGN
jgi:hypothetical protein